MKRTLTSCLVLLAVLLCVMLIPFSASAKVTADNLAYSIENNEVTITMYYGSELMIKRFLIVLN